MAAKGRRQAHSLIERLAREPHRFEFFQAVRLLEQAARREARDPRFEGRRAVGEDGDPRREAVRFAALQSLSFPTSQIAAFTTQKAADPAQPAPPPRLTVSFMGLTGPSGVLPQQFTEQLIRSVRAKSFSLRDFLDLFNHRIVSLFHRAWEKYRLPVAYERGGAGAKDPISAALFALVGLGSGQMRGRLAVDDEAVVHFAGHLAHGPTSASGLEAMLSDYFERRVSVEQFRGRWMYLAVDERSRMPGTHDRETAFCELGVNAVVGDRVWDVQGAFRIRLGPLTYRQFLRFMPSGEDLRKLAQLTRLYVGPGLGFDVQVSLARDEVPACQLLGEGAEVPRLGWNTWVKSGDLDSDANDAVYRLDRL
ncbi:MAG: type VI secretion system baseplate subunit TssG [Inquilinus sp.]|nr:type VI secretion system baseplate subunit TssG [Inquilinus sp.]